MDHDENNRIDHLPPEERVSAMQSKASGETGYLREGLTLPAMQERYSKIGGHELGNHDQASIDRHLQQIDVERRNTHPIKQATRFKYNPSGNYFP